MYTSLGRRSFLKLTAATLMAAPAVIQSGQALAEAFTFKYGNGQDNTYPHTVRMREAADRIGAESHGNVTLKVFPLSQLGSDTDMLAQVRSGAIDFATISGLILSTLVPVTAIHGVAFAWKNNEMVWSAMDGDLGAHVRTQIEKSGLAVGNTIWDSGFRQITSGSRRIEAPQDLLGFKIRVPVSPTWTSLFRALGAAPVSLNFAEVYTALQTKIVDGQENALAMVESGKLYEVQHHLSLTSHMWDGNWFLMNRRRWQSLPDEVKQLVSRHVEQSARDSRADMAKINTELLTTLKQRGMEVNSVDQAPFRKKLADAKFFEEWQRTFGKEAWTLLEKYAGQIS
jgi:TRAP-type transport system periplasmic protein